jgi:hypothetical protein
MVTASMDEPVTVDAATLAAIAARADSMARREAVSTELAASTVPRVVAFMAAVAEATTVAVVAGPTAAEAVDTGNRNRR